MAMLAMPSQSQRNMVSLTSSLDTPTNDLGHDFEKMIKMCILEAKRTKKHLNQEIGIHDSATESIPINTPKVEFPEVEDGEKIKETPIHSESEKDSIDIEERNKKKNVCDTGIDKSNTDMATLPNSETASISNKTDHLRHNSKKTRVKMTRVKRKKWRMAGDLLNFDFPLLTKRCTNSDLEEEEMNKELMTFENICKEDEQDQAITVEKEEEKVKTASDTVENKEDINEMKKCPVDNLQTSEEISVIGSLVSEERNDGKKLGAISFSCHFDRDNSKRYNDICQIFDEADNFYEYDSILDLEGKISKQERIFMHSYEGSMPKIHLRSKKKWKIPKTRKQIRSKCCTELTNRTHGQKLFMHFRLYKKLEISEWPRKQDYLPNPKKLYMEAEKKLEKKAVKRRYGLPVEGNHRLLRDSYKVATSTKQKNKPKQNHRVDRHVVNAYNADGALEADLVNILINLQNRDLTPEDYEILLRLDDSVAPKTIDSNLLNSFKTDTVTEELVEQSCQICMDNYAIGEIRKHLPCGHIFHGSCIDSWLGNSSTNCPLDGLSVSES